MKILSWFFGFILFLFTTQPVAAAYALPYPSYMPGHKLYTVSRIFDQVKSYWYWGSIAQFKYRLSLADKYLIEAKTLFEYGQYFLAMDALNRSNRNIELLSSVMKKAQKEEKNIVELQNKIEEAMVAHVAVLNDLGAKLPREFLWQPEKEIPTPLLIDKLNKEALYQRKKLITPHAQ